MSSKVVELTHKSLLPGAPGFLADTVQYEVVMGSMAYGVSNDHSDMDVYGFAIPPREVMFPHLRGEVPGFDDCEVQFEQYQQHHIQDPTALGGRGREYDITIYSISKYFKLLMNNNPNIIDSLFVPDNCRLYSTPIADMVYAQRHQFLHKGCWATFKGYAYGQMHKMRIKQPVGKRAALVEQYGYDVKFAYHVVRLLNEVEQILHEHDLDLARNREQLKAIRRGEWSLAQVETYFRDKEQALEAAYQSSTLPAAPNVPAIRKLLMCCLEEHFGCLDVLVKTASPAEDVLQQIQTLLKNYA